MPIKRSSPLEETLSRSLNPLLVIVIVGLSGFLLGMNLKSSEPSSAPEASSQSNPTEVIDQIEQTLSAQAGSPEIPATPPKTSVSVQEVKSPSPAGQPISAKPSIINLNSATKAELETLPGIGPTKAQAILDYRSANGPFIRLDDLIKVKGIGPKTLEKIKPQLTL